MSNKTVSGMELHCISCGMVNCWLLRAGDAALLVDAGNAGDEKKILPALERLGVDAGKLAMVLLTHGHPDHVGAAEYLRRQYQVPLALHPGDARDMPPLERRGFFGQVLGLATGKPAGTPPVPDIELTDGMRLDACGFAATVLALPGHTAGSVGLLLDDGRLVAGDMYMCFFGPHGAYIAEDFAQYDATAAALKARGDIATVYPGHGRPCDFSSLV